MSFGRPLGGSAVLEEARYPEPLRVSAAGSRSGE
jgi:hypothetical protein